MSVFAYVVARCCCWSQVSSGEWVSLRALSTVVAAQAPCGCNISFAQTVRRVCLCVLVSSAGVLFKGKVNNSLDCYVRSI